MDCRAGRWPQPSAAIRALRFWGSENYELMALSRPRGLCLRPCRPCHTHLALLLLRPAQLGPSVPTGGEQQQRQEQYPSRAERRARRPTGARQHRSIRLDQDGGGGRAGQKEGLLELDWSEGPGAAAVAARRRRFALVPSKDAALLEGLRGGFGCPWYDSPRRRPSGPPPPQVQSARHAARRVVGAVATKCHAKHSTSKNDSVTEAFNTSGSAAHHSPPSSTCRFFC